MKKVKVSLLAVAAIMLGVFSSAFTTPSSTAVDDGWFLYNGSGPLDNPSSYTYTGSIASCNSNVHFCAMKGIRQDAPNQNRPTLQSLQDASAQSSQFTIPVDDEVVFKP